MDKLTVIIPTLQKKIKVLLKSVEQLEKEVEVGEIIIINNQVDKPLPSNFSGRSKVRIVAPSENFYVNPSWNLGISLARYKRYLLLNDDILFEEGFCKKVMDQPQWNDKNLGVIGMFIGNINEIPSDNSDTLETPPTSNDTVFFIEKGTRYLHTGNWGVAIFGRTKDYCAIPDDFKVIYGDNYLLYKNLKDGKTNYDFYGIKANHLTSSTSRDNCVSRVVVDDLHAAENYFE